jgi:hypothetical protein
MVTTGIKQTTDTGRFIAQSFIVPTPNDVAGAYVTKIDLFFKEKVALSQVKIFLAEVVNNVPDTTKIVPGTVVYVNSADITISSVGTTATTFNFAKPIFLSSTEQYAICVQTPAKDFVLWGSAIGDVDIASGKNLGSNPMVDKLYYRETNGSFSVVENESMKFNLHRAKFDTTVTGTAVLRPKQNYEYILMKSFQTGKTRSVTPTGLEKIYKQTDSGWEFVGDFVSMHRVADIDTEKFLVVVDNKSATAEVDAEDVIKIVREEYTAANTQTGVVGSNVAYTTNFSKVETEFLDGEIEAIKDYEYHSLLPRLDIDLKTGSSVNFSVKATKKNGANFIKDEIETSISPSFEKPFSDQSRWLPSKSKFVDDALEITAYMNAQNDFCAPIISLDASRALMITNVINADSNILTDSNNETTDTELTTNGKAIARYTTKTITLAEGMDAEDIRVFVSAYKPSKTNVRVYARFQNAEDNSKSILDTPWIKLEQVTNEAVFSDSRNPNNFIEYEYKLSDTNKSNGVLRYEDSDGNDYLGYKRYSIKIVLTADNEYEFNPPKVTDLKVIALQR